MKRGVKNFIAVSIMSLLLLYTTSNMILFCLRITECCQGWYCKTNYAFWIIGIIAYIAAVVLIFYDNNNEIKGGGNENGRE